MPTTLEIKGILEEKLELLIQTGMYTSKTEAVRDAIRKMLEAQDFLQIAIYLYKEGKISTGKAAEIANLTTNDFLIECQKRRVPIKVGLETIDELKEEMSQF